MRLWLAYVLKPIDKSLKRGNVLVFRKPSMYCAKGHKDLFRTINVETNEIKEWAVIVGLGYVDVKNMEEYIQKSKDIVIKKLKQLGLDEEVRFLKELGEVDSDGRQV